VILDGAEAKKFFYEIVQFSNDVTEDGRPVPRSTFVKKHYVAVRSFNGKLKRTAQHMWLPHDMEPKDATQDDIKYAPYEVMPEMCRFVGLKFDNTAAIELNDGEVAMLKYFYEEREELPMISEEGYAEIASILGLELAA